MKGYFLLILLAVLMMSCNFNSPKVGSSIFEQEQKSQIAKTSIDLSEIQTGGELIVLTMYGPVSYFEFRGENFGQLFKLAEAFGQSIGVKTRVEVCRNEKELLKRLLCGDGDIVTCGLPAVDSLKDEVAYCGVEEISKFIDTLAIVERDASLHLSAPVGWVVRRSSSQLAQVLDEWIDLHKDDFFDLSMPKTGADGKRRHLPSRHPQVPIRNLAKGEISEYDPIFKKYAHVCGWDWRLLAAQAYQESAFDPNAVSWMGALGLMQLMPATARQVGVAESEVFSPDASVRGATRLISELDSHYSSVGNREDRLCFILAAYNAGPGHVDDARRLASKYGRNPDRWSGNVDQFVLHMSEARYFNDPLVKHGYFRGSETFNYVEDIKARWSMYRSKIR